MNNALHSAVSFRARLPRDGFSLDAAFEAQSGITVLFGPSGSGKTTILHLIAGLLRPQAGYIRIRDRILTDTETGIAVPKHKRRVGLVFQDAQLFPHMSVEQNLRFGAWFAPRPEARVDLATVARVLGIDGLMRRRPPGLSGGERQRVALARALLSSPDILLLDEPLASLDYGRRQEILPLIERMRDEFAVPMVYVTHDAEEALRLADSVVLLDRGRVAAQGKAADVIRSGGISVGHRPDASPSAATEPQKP